MTSNYEYPRSILTKVVSVFGWLHSKLFIIPIIAVIVIAVILGTHLGFSQLLDNPIALIVGGVGVIVGVHVLVIFMFAFLAQRRRQRKHISDQGKKGSSSHQNENTEFQHQNEIKLETKGQTIPWASIYDGLVWLVSFGKMQAIRKDIISLLHFEHGDTVLDVGCGTGDLALEIQGIISDKGKMYGIDASPKMIGVAKRKADRISAGTSFQVGLIEDIAFPDNNFDVVLNSLVMHHLPDDLKLAGLSEIYRVLKPSGRILIVDIESTSDGSWIQKLADFVVNLHGGHAIMHDNVQKLIPLVEEAGFKNVETSKINRQMSYIKALKQ
ncbi:MAG: class I SAM-dependent methyltransferase [Candidatus Marinimicrobia bacterium]|nr:class I SAM-dependent methyltransferase [Candidatus Neomarinimicrobiota bacterium]